MDQLDYDLEMKGLNHRTSCKKPTKVEPHTALNLEHEF